MSQAWLVRTAPNSTRDFHEHARVPLVVYVLWHPKFTDGPALARELYDWLAGNSTDSRAVGLGIPVYFRSRPWDPTLSLDGGLERMEETATGAAGEESTNSSLPDPLKQQHDRRMGLTTRPIEVFRAEHNVFLPLVDEHMIEDPAWRRDLLDLARHHAVDRSGALDNPPQRNSNVTLMAFQLCDHWARLPIQVTRIKALHLRRWDDPRDQTGQQRVLGYKNRLRRLVTQALTTLLHHCEAREQPREVFLSHAKGDGAYGPGVAEELRDKAAGYGQIEVFYDENDLLSGTDFKRRMLGAARTSAGFIAVMSDLYASRYWCRQEVEVARTPRRLCEPEETSRDRVPETHIWTVQPTVVVDTLQGGWTSMISDLATVPVVRWAKDRAAEVYDVLFRAALIQAVQRRYALSLWRSLSSEEQETTHLVTWTPDAATLCHLASVLAEASPAAPNAPSIESREATTPTPGRTIAYPGHGFLPTEETRIQGALRGRFEVISYEQLADRSRGRQRGEAQRPVRQRPLIAMSAGDSADLDVLGYDMPPTSVDDSVHLDEVVLRLVRALLRADLRIAYGGILRKGRSFLTVMQEVSAAHQERAQQEAPPPPKTEAELAGPISDEDVEPTTLLENYVAVGHPKSADDRARMQGIVRHHDVAPPLSDGPLPTASEPFTSWQKARALSHMRVLVARRTYVTVALAGKQHGYTGFLPGVAEELLCAMEHALKLYPEGTSAGSLDMLDDGRHDDRMASLRGCGPQHVRVILLGAFGGVTRQMARYILVPTSPMPACLTLEGQRAKAEEEGRPTRVPGSPPEAEAWVRRRFEALHACLDGLRAVARDPTARLGALGLSVGDWCALMRADSVGFMRRQLVESVAPAVHKAHGS
jgi:hypothetical protein